CTEAPRCEDNAVVAVPRVPISAAAPTVLMAAVSSSELDKHYSFFEALYHDQACHLHAVSDDNDPILRRLYVGSKEAATDKRLLMHYNITHIVIAHPQLPAKYEGRLKYYRVNMRDLPDYNLLDDLPGALGFIDEALNDNEHNRVLVHCSKGVSRSSSIAIAYVMFLRGLTFSEAFSMVEAQRPHVYPNLGFQAQLTELQKYLGSEQKPGNRKVVERACAFCTIDVIKSIKSRIRDGLAEVDQKVDAILDDNLLLQRAVMWKRLGLFFENLHKYRVVVEDEELINDAGKAAKQLESLGTVFASSIEGVRYAKAVADEIRGWMGICEQAINAHRLMDAQQEEDDGEKKKKKKKSKDAHRHEHKKGHRVKSDREEGRAYPPLLIRNVRIGIGKEGGADAAAREAAREMVADDQGRDRDLGEMRYEEAASVLSRESGCVSARGEVILMRKQITSGLWDEALASLETLEIDDDSVKKLLGFDIREEQFLEAVREYLWSIEAIHEEGWDNTEGARRAVEALQALAALAEEDEILSSRLHDNANRLLYASGGEFDIELGECKSLEGKRSWNAERSREKLWESIRAQLPAEVCVPPGRLMTLLEYAQQYQVDRCIHHELAYDEKGDASLLRDHHCPSPKVTLAPAEIIRKHSDEVWYVALSNSGRVLATCGKDKTIILWTVSNIETARKHGESLRYMDTLIGHEDECAVCSFNCDDTYLASGANDGAVKIWKMPTTFRGGCHCTIDAHSEVVTQVVWRPGCRTQVVSAGHDKTVVISDVEENRVLLTVRLRARVHDICFAPLSGSSLWVASGRQLAAITGLNDTGGPSSGGESGFSVLYRIERLVTETSLITCITPSRHDPDLVLFALDSKPAMIRLWNVRERRPLGRYMGHTRGRFNLKCVFGGEKDSLVLSGSDDARIFIWHRASSALLHVLSGAHHLTVNALVWLPSLAVGRSGDEKKLPCVVSVSDDSTVVVWTGAEEAARIRTAAPPRQESSVETTDDILMSLMRHSEDDSPSGRSEMDEDGSEFI
ncbi:hypothetical protein FOL46_001587, partial [Perkinsus olseni]